MCFPKEDARFLQARFQIFFRTLLGMETSRIVIRIFARPQFTLSCDEISFGFLYPFKR